MQPGSTVFPGNPLLRTLVPPGEGWAVNAISHAKVPGTGRRSPRHATVAKSEGGMPGQCHCLGPEGTIRIENATQNWAPAQTVESRAWAWWVERKEPISLRLASRPIRTCLGTCWPMTMLQQVTPHLQVKPIGPAKGFGVGPFRPPNLPLLVP